MKYVVKRSEEKVVECSLRAEDGGIYLDMGDWTVLFVDDKGVKLATDVGSDIGIALDHSNGTVKILRETV